MIAIQPLQAWPANTVSVIMRGMARSAGRPRNTPLPEQLPNRLLKVREELRLSRAEVARRAGMKDETLRRYEEGRRGVDTAKLRRIAEAMGKRLEDVLLPTDVARGADSPTPAPERSAAIRQKKLEIAVLYIDEIAAGQPAEVRAKLLNEALAYLDGLGQKVSANGIG